MKRVLVFLMLCGLCFAANPVLIRDPFSSKVHSLYVPTNKAGYYAKWDFEDAGRTGYSSACRVSVGPVYNGKVNCRNTTVASYHAEDWSTDGSFNNGQINSHLYYAYSTSASGKYIACLIPANHNLIHLIVYNVNSNGDTVNIDWKDGSTTGLSLTSWNSGIATLATGTYDVVIATNAAPDGSGDDSTIRFTKTSSTIFRIIGVRSWNTSQVGTVETENGAGIWMGHGLVTQKTLSTTVTTLPERFDDVASGYGWTLNGTQIAIDTAFKWYHTGTVPATSLWSGGYAHMTISAANAEYTHTAASSYLTDGPDIFVNGVDSGGMIELGQSGMKTGYEVKIKQAGFWDYDGDGTSADAVASADPTVTWTVTANASGTNFNFNVVWNDDATVSTTANETYGMMMGIQNTTQNRYVIANGVKTLLSTTANQSISGDVSNVDLWIPEKDIIIKMSNNLPGDSLYWVYSTKKFYFEFDAADMPGGATPTTGTVWDYGGTINFEYADTDMIFKSDPTPRRLTVKEQYIKTQ